MKYSIEINYIENNNKKREVFLGVSQCKARRLKKQYLQKHNNLLITLLDLTIIHQSSDFIKKEVLTFI